jgi:hypothetical protein
MLFLKLHLHHLEPRSWLQTVAAAATHTRRAYCAQWEPHVQSLTGVIPMAQFNLYDLASFFFF